MNNFVAKQAQKAKHAALQLRSISSKQKNMFLTTLLEILEDKKESLQQENTHDVEQAQKLGKYGSAFLDRLTLSDQSFSSMLDGVKVVKDLSDPTGQILETRELKVGATLQRVSVPLGVIGIIYESRPNVTVDAAILCLKAGNAVVLKGGSAAIRTNRMLARCLKDALARSGLPVDSVQFIDQTDRSATQELLQQEDAIDVIIPRGGAGLIRAVVEQSRIPVLYHADGICHTYIDVSAQQQAATEVVLDAKTDRPGTCCSTETLLLHQDLPQDFLLQLFQRLIEARVQLRLDAALFNWAQTQGLSLSSNEHEQGCRLAQQQDWDTEHLALILNVKQVEGVEKAIDFINVHGSRHSEAILAEDEVAITRFQEGVDTAAIFVNASTRLHDGGVFELGAEVGIATGKLHARGPVGLNELCTYQYLVRGNGTTRGGKI